MTIHDVDEQNTDYFDLWIVMNSWSEICYGFLTCELPYFLDLWTGMHYYSVNWRAFLTCELLPILDLWTVMYSWSVNVIDFLISELLCVLDLGIAMLSWSFVNFVVNTLENVTCCLPHSFAFRVFLLLDRLT